MELCRTTTAVAPFHLHPDGPEEAEQFAPYSGYDLWRSLTGCSQAVIALVQAVLSLPGNFFDFFIDSLLTFAQSCSDSGAMSVSPRRLHHYPTKMSIAGFCDRST